MKNEELDELSRNIPISIFREKYPELHEKPKKPYIEKLREENIEELEYLALYYSLKRKTSFFLIKVKTGVLFKIKEFEGKKIKLDGIDNIFEIKEVVVQNENEYIVQIKAHSRKYKLSNLEDVTTLEKFSVEFRKPYSIHLICHLDDSSVEVYTRSQPKVLLTIALFSYILGANEEDFELVILKEKDSETLKDKIHHKEVLLDGLNYAGLEQVTLRGSDVKRALKYFKEKGIDLEGEAKDKKFIRSEMSEQPISFNQTGKISVSRKIKNAYSYIKGVFKKW